MSVQQVTTFLTIEEIKEIFPVDESSIRKWCRTKKGIFAGAFLNSEKEWLIPEVDILKFTGGAKKLYVTKQAAEMLDMSMSQLRHAIATQELQYLRFEKLYFITAEAIDEYKKNKAETMPLDEFLATQKKETQTQLFEAAEISTEQPHLPQQMPLEKKYKHSDVTFGIWDSHSKIKLSTTVTVADNDNPDDVLNYAKKWVTDHLAGQS